MLNMFLAGLSGEGSVVFSETLKIVFWIGVFFVGMAVLVGFFNDRVNAIFCIIIAVALFFFVPKINQIFASFSLNEDGTLDISKLAICWAIFLGATLLIRDLPCLSISSEKNTYLIFGTLIEETENHILGLGVTVGVPALFGFGYYFLADLMINNGFAGVGYVTVGVFLLFSLVGFGRSFAD